MVALRPLHSLVESDRRTIDEIAASLPAGWPVDAIVLYGSKARGDDTPDSDIDLLVLTGRPLTPEETGRMRELVRRGEPWQQPLGVEPGLLRMLSWSDGRIRMALPRALAD